MVSDIFFYPGIQKHKRPGVHPGFISVRVAISRGGAYTSYWLFCSRILRFFSRSRKTERYRVEKTHTKILVSQTVGGP